MSGKEKKESAFQRFTGMFTRNFSLKLLALVLAILIYLLVEPEAARHKNTLFQRFAPLQSINHQHETHAPSAAHPQTANPPADAVKPSVDAVKPSANSTKPSADSGKKPANAGKASAPTNCPPAKTASRK